MYRIGRNLHIPDVNFTPASPSTCKTAPAMFLMHVLTRKRRSTKAVMAAYPEVKVALLSLAGLQVNTLGVNILYLKNQGDFIPPTPSTSD